MIIAPKPTAVSFDDYSRKYDMLLNYSSPYQQIGEFILVELKKRYQSRDPFSVLDIGGGTGNFSKIIADAFPNAIIHLLEPNEKMLAIAKHKLKHTTTTFSQLLFQDFQSAQKYDVLLCIHALYLMPHSRALIPRFKEFMHENSSLIVCDIGQEIKVMDWTFFLFLENSKKHGLRRAIQIIQTAAEIKQSNREIAKKQRNGQLWQHTLEEFKSFFSEYYQIQIAFTCYRGCSNFLVCQLK